MLTDEYVARAIVADRTRRAATPEVTYRREAADMETTYQKAASEEAQTQRSGILPAVLGALSVCVGYFGWKA